MLTLVNSAAAAAIAARLDRLPPSRHLRNVVLLLCLGAFFEIYDLTRNPGLEAIAGS
jgi:putative MFS transporter